MNSITLDGINWIILTVILVVGGAAGISLNRQMYRQTTERVTTQQACKYCKLGEINTLAQLPIVGWIHANGKCTTCGRRLDPKGLILDWAGLGIGITWGFEVFKIFWECPTTLANVTPEEMMGLGINVLVLTMTMYAMRIASFQDLQERAIDTRATYGLLSLSLVFAILENRGIVSVAMLLFGYGLYYTVYFVQWLTDLVKTHRSLKDVLRVSDKATQAMSGEVERASELNEPADSNESTEQPTVADQSESYLTTDTQAKALEAEYEFGWEVRGMGAGDLILYLSLVNLFGIFGMAITCLASVLAFTVITGYLENLGYKLEDRAKGAMEMYPFSAIGMLIFPLFTIATWVLRLPDFQTTDFMLVEAIKQLMIFRGGI